MDGGMVTVLLKYYSKKLIKLPINQGSGKCFPLPINNHTMKNIIMILLLCPAILVAQEKNQLMFGVHARPHYIRVSKLPGSYFGPTPPKVDFQAQVTNLSFKGAIEGRDLKWGLTFGLEYIIRYDHICFNTSVPDTNISYYTIGESINGFIKDYIIYVKKPLSLNNTQTHLKISYGLLNRGTKFIFTTYGGSFAPGSHVFYRYTKNLAYNAFGLGFGITKNKLNYELDLYLITRNEHSYDQYKFDFIIPGFSIQYNIKLPTKVEQKL